MSHAHLVRASVRSSYQVGGGRTFYSPASVRASMRNPQVVGGRGYKDDAADGDKRARLGASWSTRSPRRRVALGKDFSARGVWL